jgi:hypothetical protein
MRQPLLLSALFAGAAVLNGCFGALKDAQDQALKLETAMRQQMANGDVAGIYNNDDQSYHDAATREKSDALFNAIAQKLGTPLTCGQGGINVTVNTSGTFIRSECATPFSKNAKATETFVWKKSGNEFKLAGYHINSDELITR